MMRCSTRRLSEIFRRVATIALAFGVLSTIVPRQALTEPPCDEPTDQAYLDRMEQVGVAIEQSDFETVLAHIDWALEHYDYAILEYGRARALHNLDRYADAEAAYNTFLRSFDGCPDPDMLIISTRQYRSLAVQEQASALDPGDTSPNNRPDPPSTTDDPVIGEQAPPPDGGVNAGWFVMGAGGVLIVSAVIHDIAKSHLLDDQKDAYDAGDVDEYYRLEDEITRARTVDWILYGTGIVAVGVGVTMLLINRGNDDPPDRTFGVEASRGGGMVHYGMVF